LIFPSGRGNAFVKVLAFVANLERRVHRREFSAKGQKQLAQGPGLRSTKTLLGFREETSGGKGGGSSLLHLVFPGYHNIK